MIYDRFENAAQYFKQGELLQAALDYAANFDPAIADGKHEIDGDTLYGMVASYDTSPAEERRFEAHKDYIDIQIVLEGEERIDVYLEQNLQTVEDYSEINDVEFFESPASYSSLVMKPGYFAIFFPHDIHRPNCRLNAPSKVRKLVIKVKV